MIGSYFGIKSDIEQDETEIPVSAMWPNAQIL